MQSNAVVGTIHYAKRIAEPLYMYNFMEPPPGVPPTNHELEAHDLVIESIRGLPDRCDVNVQGFELVEFEPVALDIYDRSQRAKFFDPAVADFVKRRTGATFTQVFDAFLRGPEAQRRAPGSITAPAGCVHVDYTHESGPQWFDKLLGDEATRYRGRRFAIINFWRPIAGPLRDYPLALCDARTVSSDDWNVSKSYACVAANGLYSSDGELSISEVNYPSFNDQHRWYYVPEMRTDEALLLKNYDSAEHGSARFSPHCAFKDPTAPADVLPRASIEVRVLTMW